MNTKADGRVEQTEVAAIVHRSEAEKRGNPEAIRAAPWHIDGAPAPRRDWAGRRRHL